MRRTQPRRGVLNNPTRYQRARATAREIMMGVSPQDARAFFRVWKDLDVEFPEPESDSRLNYLSLIDHTTEAVGRGNRRLPTFVDMLTHKASDFYERHADLFPEMLLSSDYAGLILSLAVEGSPSARKWLTEGRSDNNLKLSKLL